jgi:hypothetical protein
MNPEEVKNHCRECGDPITTQHEIDFELCDECFNLLKEEQEADLERDEFLRDQKIRDENCEL